MKKLNPIIQGLFPSLTERGKIKIGRKGETRQSQGGNDYKLPEKLDHFIVTTMQRGADGNFLKDEEIHKIFGAEPKEIPINLIYDDLALNFQCSYAKYKGRTLACRGDGQIAYQLMRDYSKQERQCPCECALPTYTGDDKCKMNGSLSCMIEGAPGVGGIWKYRTTSYNSIVGILSSMALIKRITRGALAGLPLKLRISPKTVANPITQKMQHIFVVSLEFPGNVRELRDRGFSALLEAKTHDMKVDNIEKEAAALLSYDPASEPGDEDEDIVSEFYPVQHAASEGIKINETGAPPIQAPQAPQAPRAQVPAGEKQPDASAGKPQAAEKEPGTGKDTPLPAERPARRPRGRKKQNSAGGENNEKTQPPEQQQDDPGPAGGQQEAGEKPAAQASTAAPEPSTAEAAPPLVSPETTGAPIVVF